MSTPDQDPKKTQPKTPPGDRIAKVLSRAGVASRREAEKMIGEGRVSVNGKVIDSPALNVTARDKVAVDGRPLDAPEPARLWLYHKPTGLVTTARDEQGRPTIFDELPDDMPRVMSVGRLDLNSEGLLLLTNDGGLKRRLELPSTGWLRRYRVRVKGNPTDATFAPLREGIVLNREEFQPMQITLDRQQGSNAWLTVGLREGKNREVRRAMESIGLSVNRLIRISYGPFQLGPLAPGGVEEVRRRVLRDQLGLEAEDEDAKPRPTRQRGKGPGKPGMRPGNGAGAGPRPGPGAPKGGKPKSGEKPARGAARGAAVGTPGRKPGDQARGKSAKPKGDAPWGDDRRPKLTRRRPKKD
ncbi:pseudouridine synthase [Pseudooceanicola onchidii]|uniref:pseudouridine synthase n=1 Tax=Pseudooceanicola onchidii TaxID=2562279 RepID=UPI0010AA0593|nr:pseudouridine synthase [Pseudooceanicola onchidii]